MCKFTKYRWVAFHKPTLKTWFQKILSFIIHHKRTTVSVILSLQMLCTGKIQIQMEPILKNTSSFVFLCPVVFTSSLVKILYFILLSSWCSVFLAQAFHLFSNFLPISVMLLYIIGVVHNKLVRLAIVGWVPLRVIAEM